MHVKSRIINRLSILRMSHNPQGDAFPVQTVRDRAKRDVGEPGCRAGRCEVAPLVSTLGFIFPRKSF